MTSSLQRCIHTHVRRYRALFAEMQGSCVAVLNNSLAQRCRHTHNTHTQTHTHTHTRTHTRTHVHTHVWICRAPLQRYRVLALRCSRMRGLCESAKGVAYCPSNLLHAFSTTLSLQRCIHAYVQIYKAFLRRYRAIVLPCLTSPVSPQKSLIYPHICVYTPLQHNSWQHNSCRV